jgi:uncharacterized membrane protein
MRQTIGCAAWVLLLLGAGILLLSIDSVMSVLVACAHWIAAHLVPIGFAFVAVGGFTLYFWSIWRRP